ncbi:PREDICTED: LOW QUALITY PROTEIN: endo-1,3(4)-beta-glucanase 2-like [Brassica oleracea var. oleracea]|nr:PREDICTED: LOW QUALITY PROTEIN: endo-1,3(4)-beta-glucanase 2-like [Brassica oleracea var. oleracea]
MDSSNAPYLFPRSDSTVLPDPSRFFSHDLLSSPLPTNSFFQNLFTLKNGDQAENFHPYLIKTSPSSLSISYPSLTHNPAVVYKAFTADITITGSDGPDPHSRKTHLISSFSDLGVTLDFPSSNLRFFLVRGSPFVTCFVSNNSSVTISTTHAVSSFSGNRSSTKYTAKLNNDQTWLIYSSSPINLVKTGSAINSTGGFSGIIRFVVLPDSNQDSEPILDRFSVCYPVSGDADFTKPFEMEYTWQKRGYGDLLMLAHPLHLKLLSTSSSTTVLDTFRYKSLDGDLVGVVGDTWLLKPAPIPVTWHSLKGIKEDHHREEIISALVENVDALDSSADVTSASYFYGKLIARAARFVLIAGEVSHLDVVPKIRNYLKSMIEPWLDGSFGPNGFLYDPTWGGLITKLGSKDSGGDFGFGIYNDHHYHLGYFLYAIAVLVKIDNLWGKKYRPQVYALAADYMTLGKKGEGSSSVYTRLRCFDFFKLHSWAGGLTEFTDGRNQESTSEAVNGYYSAALLGLAYGDIELAAVASTVLAFEIHAAKMWWQVKEEDTLYPSDFTAENRVVGVLWSTKRDSGLWFAPKEWKECRLGIQLLPILPVSEILFSDVKFAKQLVDWTLPALDREGGVGEGWKGFLYALESMYDKDGAMEKVKGLKGHDDGNSLSNLLWWIHSRNSGDE